MKKITPLLFAAISFLVGCANQIQPITETSTQGERRLESAKRISTHEQSKLTKCSDNLRDPKVNPATALAYKVVDSDIIFRNEDAPNKITLMTTTAKINKRQIAYLLESIQPFQKCRTQIKEGLSMYPILLAPYENYYGEMDVVYSRLISGQITIGEANRQKAALVLKATNENTTAQERLTAKYANESDKEMQGRQAVMQAQQAEDMQRRAIASQYLMNLQNINAQQQMNYQNQINNNRPINTNCTRYGNQVNCTSQ